MMPPPGAVVFLEWDLNSENGWMIPMMPPPGAVVFHAGGYTERLFLPPMPPPRAVEVHVPG